MPTETFVTLAQHEASQEAQHRTIERLSVRVEVISHDTSRLLTEMADVREDLAEFRQSVEGRFQAIEARLDTIEARLDAIEARLDAIEGRFDNHEKLLNAILSTVMQLAKQPP